MNSISFKRIKSFLDSPCFIALILLGIFLIMTSYKYGWDDQQLEIPLLKHLIDPTLYQGDYYVESLTHNFSSYFYPILAKLISVEQIPAVYFILYIICRYFLLFFAYKLWLVVSKSRFEAFACVCVFMYVVRVEEFLYRTFSHQEFALAIVFAGLYYFFKNRFLLSALLFGVAANFNAIYSLFPMTYLGIYLLWQGREDRFKTLFKASLTFVIFSLPFIIWIFQNRLSHGLNPTDAAHSDWLSLYILACPQNFFFPEAPRLPFKLLTSDINIFLQLTGRYLFLISLFCLNFFFHPNFRQDKKGLSISLSAMAYLVLCFIFTYLHPNKFLLDLNIVRNDQYLLYFLMGYTTILTLQTINSSSALLGLSLAILFAFLKFQPLIATFAALTMIFIFLCVHTLNKRPALGKTLITAITMAGILACSLVIKYYFDSAQFRFLIRMNLLIIFILLLGIYFAHHLIKTDRKKLLIKNFFLLVPLIVFFFQYTYFRFDQVNVEREGRAPFWKIQKSWEDMQSYVKATTPKDTLLLVPYNMEMGGFRIFSERKVICCYRDCGIVGFDYHAAVEWQRRINDIKAFKVTLDGPTRQAITMAIMKYHADYIVFMRYAAPLADSRILERKYTNENFVLFKVNLPDNIEEKRRLMNM